MPVTDATATVGIVDDRVAMSADGDVSVILESPDTQPLSEGETHATLRVVGDDYRASVELDTDALAALTDALADAQEGDVDA